LPKRLQPMLATLTNAPFEDAGRVFEDKYDGFRIVAKTEGGEVAWGNQNPLPAPMPSKRRRFVYNAAYQALSN
jgi:hypothetical protein